EEIASVVERVGISVPFLRPKELAADDTPMLPVIQHAVRSFVESNNRKPDYILLIQPTSPFVRTSQIEEALTLLENSEADAVTTVVEVPHNLHPYNARVLEDGCVRFFMEEEHYRYTTRQSKPKLYAFGNLYAFTYSTLMDQGSFFGERCLAYLIDPISAFDINDPTDLLIAECIAKGGLHVSADS
ncbi:MAG: acylneuraminate cytidylyltransferase family protein, partial [Dehalococcoidia bacterium]